MPTQLEEAQTAISLLRGTSVETEVFLRAPVRLQDVLARAQNALPDGAADGSIDETAWTGFRAVFDAARCWRSVALQADEGLG